MEIRAVWEAGDVGPGGKEPAAAGTQAACLIGVSAVVLGSQPVEPVGYLSTGLILTASRSLCTAALGYTRAGRGVPHEPALGGRGLSAPE